MVSTKNPFPDTALLPASAFGRSKNYASGIPIISAKVLVVQQLIPDKYQCNQYTLREREMRLAANLAIVVVFPTPVGPTIKTIIPFRSGLT